MKSKDQDKTVRLGKYKITIKFNALNIDGLKSALVHHKTMNELENRRIEGK